MKLFVGDLATGRNIIPIPAHRGDWEIRRNRSGSLSCDVTLSTRAHRRLDLRQNAAVGHTYLALGEGEHIFAAGPIWDHDYDDDARHLHIEAEGMWSLLMRRFIMPAAVETISLLLESGDDAGKPNPAVATIFTGDSWPTIVQGILEQGFARAGGALPLVFGPAGTGAHDKSYDASSFKSQGEALTDLTELVNGPEIEFRPQFSADRRGLEWNVLVGDDTRPQISSLGLPHRFDFSVPKRTVRKLRVRSSAREMSSEAWATGGRQAAIALISRKKRRRCSWTAGTRAWNPCRPHTRPLTSRTRWTRTRMMISRWGPHPLSGGRSKRTSTRSRNSGRCSSATTLT